MPRGGRCSTRQAPCGFDHHEEAAALDAACAARRPLRVALGIARNACLAVRAHGAFGAARPAPHAHRRAEVHDGLGVVRHPLRGRVGVRQAPQRVERGRRHDRTTDTVAPRQHALDVGVQDGRAPAVALRDDGSGRRAANPRERLRRVDGVRKHTAVLARNDAGGAVQVAAPGVVAEAAPQVQYLVEVGVRQRADVGKAGDEALEVRHDRAHLGLLQHDLRDPDPIGRTFLLPRQVLAAVDVPPGEQPAGERVGGCIHAPQA